LVLGPEKGQWLIYDMKNAVSYITFTSNVSKQDVVDIMKCVNIEMITLFLQVLA